MNTSLKLFVLLLFTISLSSCSTLFSGNSSEPIGEDDRTTVMNARLQLTQVPRMTDLINDRKVKILVFVFDGTENDREKVDHDVERETVAAFLARKLIEHGYQEKYEVIYVNGPGVDSKLDAAICSTCIPKAEEALAVLKNRVNNSLEIKETEFRILVIGFSRGAAIGRHFMNLVSDTWPNPERSDFVRNESIVRTFGVLFDTVATGKYDQLRLGISPTTDYLIHVVARDERRPLFPIVLDVDRDYPPTFIRNGVLSSRYTQLVLPGVHSDIGGSYLDGLSSAYRLLAEQILVELNLFQVAEWSMENGVFDRGTHDSRGTLDKAIGVKTALEKPSGSRKSLLAESVLLTDRQREEINSRLSAYQQAKFQNFSTYSSFVDWGSSLATTRFSVQNHEGLLTFEPVSQFIYKDSVIFQNELGSGVLKYGAFGKDGKIAMSEIHITKKLRNALTQHPTSSLEIVIHQTSSHQAQIHFLVNGQTVEELPSES